MAQEKRATINDVAAAAGVSIKTVSRVVRREPNVAEATRRRVQSAVDALGYRPTQSARSTVGARSFLIGLLFDNPNPSYTSELITASLAQARADGFHMVVEPIDTGARGVADRVRKLIVQSNLAGLVLPPPLCDRERVLRVASELGRPVARIAPSGQGAPGSVFTDDEAAARTMTEHLIGLGHDRIGFVTGRQGTATTKRRLAGYRAALAGAGIEERPSLVVAGDYQYRSGMAAAEALLRTDGPPTAIFASNDDMAAGVIATAYRLGLAVPDDLAVAGFDDSLIAKTIWPPLTTMRQPVGRMAAAAIAGLTRTIRDETGAPGPRTIPCELVIRRSTAGDAA